MDWLGEDMVKRYVNVQMKGRRGTREVRVPRQIKLECCELHSVEVLYRKYILRIVEDDCCQNKKANSDMQNR